MKEIFTVETDKFVQVDVPSYSEPTAILAQGPAYEKDGSRSSRVSIDITNVSLL